MNNNNYIYAGLLFILALLVGVFFAGRLTAPKNIEYVEKPFIVESIKWDTVPEIKTTKVVNTVYKDNPNIIDTSKFTSAIDSLKIEILRLNKDSLICHKPYIDSVQFIREKDTAVAFWSYPPTFKQGLFKSKKDTTLNITKIEIRSVPVIIKRELWIDILTHTAACGVGYLIGKK